MRSMTPLPIRLPLRSPALLTLALTIAALSAAPAAAQQTAEPSTYRTPAPALAALVDAAPTPAASLSPDRTQMLLLSRAALPDIRELAEPELRLAGLRLNPRNNGPSRAGSFTGLTLQPLEPGAPSREVTGVPAGGAIRNVQWSPTSRHIAFTLDREDRIELYVVDARTAEARRLTERRINDAAPGAPLQWVAGGERLVVRAVPGDRGPAPEQPAAPAGPVIDEATGEAAPARTYQDLLQNPHDEALLEHYLTSELLEVDLRGQLRPLGIRGLLTAFAPSPDGEYLLVDQTHRPFSYLVPVYYFPERVSVHALADGRLVQQIAELPLAEDVPIGRGSVRTGPRQVEWRADEPATVAWAEALDEGDIRREAEARDRLFQWAAPFRGEPVTLATLPLRFGGVTWGDDRLALVDEWFWQTRTRRTYAIDPSHPGAEPRVLFDVSTEDRYNAPGSPVTTPNPAGYPVLATADGGQTIFLIGEGASPEGNRPFLRQMDVSSGRTEELFRSEAPFYEEPVAVVDLDERRIVTRRESVTEPPNYHVRDLDDDTDFALTRFPHPYPELAELQKETVNYTREDGVPLSATLYLPPGYDAERDGPLPALVWAYPREYKSMGAAGQRDDSPYQFKWVSYWGAVPFALRGFAVLDDAAFPIVGEGEQEPNNTFVEQLIANAQAAIDEGVRRGVVDPARVAIAGHSYGAFMTANLLAHSDLFRAGIARSGAYNRTLTPFGFQNEERTYWQAPEIYYAMSPFMHADEVDEPLLMIHGIADNNSGTFPMQSERFFNAVKGLGGTARLVMLPHESHGYRARESVLHMLWEMDRWLQTHVRQEGG